jgi:hypothetical protein
MKRPGRHKKISFDMPDWVEETDNVCLRSVAEDAYYAKALADMLGAVDKTNCEDIYHAGLKSLSRMESTKTPMKLRCKEGDRAARKFWEAKVCARGRR